MGESGIFETFFWELQNKYLVRQSPNGNGTRDASQDDIKIDI